MNIYTSDFSQVDAEVIAKSARGRCGHNLTPGVAWKSHQTGAFAKRVYHPPKTMTIPAITASQLERLVSVERFALFRRLTSHPEAAVALYSWNSKVSGGFAELLNHVEVFVRNAIHDQMVALYAQVPGRSAKSSWFDEPPWARHHWFDHHAKRQIAKAIFRAGHRPNNPNPGKVIAALNFGFWRYLVSIRYEQSFWVPALDDAFDVPGRSHPDRRLAVEYRLVFLHLLRNRISHCEPIILPIRYTHRGQPPNTKTLTDLYAYAIELVSFIDPVAARWLEHETHDLQLLLHNRP